MLKSFVSFFFKETSVAENILLLSFLMKKVTSYTFRGSHHCFWPSFSVGM